MKTGMEWPLLGLVILLVIVLGWNAWRGTQVDVAVARMQATALEQEVPEPALLAGEWLTKALVSAVIGGSVTAIVTALIVWLRKRLKVQNQTGKWKSGQYAYWAKHASSPFRGQAGSAVQPKAPSEAELMRMLVMQNLASQNGGQKSGKTTRFVQENDDEPIITL